MRLRIAILTIICTCLFTAPAQAAWAQYLEIPREQPNVLLIVVVLLIIFCLGYLRLRWHCSQLAANLELATTQIEELQRSLPDSNGVPRAVRVVEIGKAKRKDPSAASNLTLSVAPTANRVAIFERLRLSRMFAEWQEVKARAADANSHAQAALKAVEAQSKRLNEIEAKRIRCAQPRWKAAGEFSHELQHELNLRNVGAPASDLKAVWADQSLVTVMLSTSSFVATGECLGIKIVFHDKRIPDFRVDLGYLDAIGERRLLKVAVSQVACEIQPEVV